MSADSDHLQFVSDVYHKVAQPITALRHALEFALLKPLDADGYRTCIQHALEAADRTIASLQFARALADASSPGKRDERLSVSESVLSQLEQFTPLLELKCLSVGIEDLDSINVRWNPRQLETLLFLVFDQIFSIAKEGSKVSIRSTQWCLEIAFCASICGMPDHTSQSVDQCCRPLLLAQRMLESIGGKLATCTSDRGSTVSLDFPQN